MTIVYYARWPTSDWSERDEKLLIRLPPSWRWRIRRQRRPGNRQRSLWGSLLMQQALREARIPLQELRREISGRPTLKSPQPFYVSVSHTANCAVCVLSSTPVGIDVEPLRPLPTRALPLFLTPIEQSALLADSPSSTGPLHAWVQKEAVVKADGRGLQIPLTAVRLAPRQARLENHHWFLAELALHPAYVTYLASQEPLTTYQIVQMRF
jgi:4'-phosphopantetheinyl transferase